jgi:hypothetical protein
MFNILDNIQITITSTNDQISIYKDHLVNDHEKKIKRFNKFVSTLDMNDELCKKIKYFCDSLQDNNIIHLMIKYTIARYHNVNFDGNIFKKYNKILSDTFKNNLTDFTINFNDGSHFKCLKVLLSGIQYFSVIFNDFDEFQNSMILDINSEVATIVLKILYGQNILTLITMDNFVDVIKLMDMWLMDKLHMAQLLPFAEKNIDVLLQTFMDKDDFNVIRIFANNFIAGKNFEKLNKYNFKEKIFMFDDWPKKFTCEQKIEAIKLTGKFELLNVAQIPVASVLKILIECNPEDTLEMVYLMTATHNNTQVYYKQIDYMNNGCDMVAVIHDYFPKFTVTFYTKTQIQFVNGNLSHMFNKDVFIFTHPFKKVCVGSELLVGDDLKLIYNNPSNKRCISQISKNFNDKTIYYKIVPYESLPNSKCTHNNKELSINGKIWSINKVQCELVSNIQ